MRADIKHSLYMPVYSSNDIAKRAGPDKDTRDADNSANPHVSTVCKQGLVHDYAFSEPLSARGGKGGLNKREANGGSSHPQIELAPGTGLIGTRLPAQPWDWGHLTGEL